MSKHSIARWPTALVLIGTTVTVQAEDTDPFAALAAETRPLETRWQTDYSGALQIGAGYTSDDNFMFGQYNGLQEEGATVIGNLQWQDFRSGTDYWQVSLNDIGLDTREGRLSWGRPQQLRIDLGFDSQQQVRNDTGRTPFRGNYAQRLPDNWESAQTTGEFSTLDTALRDFSREIDRDRLFASVEGRLNEQWKFSSKLSYEEKEGHGDIGAGIYINGASADAVLLRTPVDFTTTEFDLGLSFQQYRLYLDGKLAYSDFDNDESLLTWQNPYNAFGPDVRYPEGTGGLALAPDNEHISGRLTGHYLFSSTTRLQFDGSYANTSQDEGFAEYSVNRNLLAPEPLPRGDLDAEVDSATANVRLLSRPFSDLPRLDTELFYRLRDRDYDMPRDGYQYIRGDGEDQPDSAQAVYNTAHDLTSQTAGFELGYPVPLRGRVTGGYVYEKVERENAAVEQSEEDRYALRLRLRPWAKTTARFSLEYGDRSADTYNWDQSYYALLDAELINLTPDSQRYNNHPLLFQYYMANREYWESKADFNYLPDARWSLNLNLSWRDNDYDQSKLGLTESRWGRLYASASYTPSTTITASAWAGYDYHEAEQSSRSFRGGQEKNAFAIYPPLPQASDPQQDWDLDNVDTSVTLGANLQWQYAPDLHFELNYSFVDTLAEQDFDTRSGGTVNASDLPDVDTRLHQVEASGIWHLRENLSLQLDYHYYNYESDDWAWDDVQADSIDKVLTFGQDNPDEDIHYLGTSVIYRWQ